MPRSREVTPVERVENKIMLIRGQKVMLDSDLAHLYGVTTKALNQQVKRNPHRFPADFMFQLSVMEELALRSQSVTSNKGRGGRRHLPFAFTEHGALMLASVLNSPRAAEMSIFVVRAFVRLRQLLATHVDLARKLETPEKKYDTKFTMVFDAIRKLMIPSEPKRRRIGFEDPESHHKPTRSK